MPRLNGCPFSVRDYAIDIRSRASTDADPAWIPIRGLTGMTFAIDTDTEDGSGADSLWGEPYGAKKRGKLSLEAKPVYDPLTGARDAGQAELDRYLMLGGLEGDARLRIADPVGNVTILDAVVTGREAGPDDSADSLSWELEQVGEPLLPPYRQTGGIALTVDGEPVSALTLAPGESRTVAVVIDPPDASNRKWGVASTDEAKVRIASKDAAGFRVTAVGASDQPVRVVARTVNNALSAELAVTIE